MKKKYISKAFRYFILIIIISIFFSSCILLDSKKMVYIEIPKEEKVTFKKAIQISDCFTFQLSEDSSYYVLTGISDFGKYLFDYNESCIFQLELSNKISPSGWSQNANMGFDVEIPSSYNNLPVKELGPNSLSYLGYYSYHLIIPESITKIRTNAIICAYSSLNTDENNIVFCPARFENFFLRVILYGADNFSNGYSDSSSHRDIFAPASITWNIGEEEIEIDPYGIRTCMFYNEPCETMNTLKRKGNFSIPSFTSTSYFRPVNIDIQLSPNNSRYLFENTILYSKDKSIVYYGYDFSLWIDFNNDLVIPDTVKEIRDGSFGLASFTTKCRKVIIGNNLKSLSTYFFDNPTSTMSILEGIEIKKGNPSFISENGMIMNREKTKLYFALLETYKEKIIPESIREISGMLFCKNGYVNLDYLKLRLIPSYNCRYVVGDFTYACAIRIVDDVSVHNEETLKIHNISFKKSPYLWDTFPEELKFDDAELSKINNHLDNNDLISYDKEYRTYYNLLNNDYKIIKVVSVPWD